MAGAMDVGAPPLEMERVMILMTSTASLPSPLRSGATPSARRLTFEAIRIITGCGLVRRLGFLFFEGTLL